VPLRRGFVLAGILLCLIGVGIVFYQINESCEDSALANAYQGYPWCTDILDHINFTFVGVVVLLAGILVIILGGPLHWMLEPTSESTVPQVQRSEVAVY
jgi:uncharacterized membrane protein